MAISPVKNVILNKTPQCCSWAEWLGAPQPPCTSLQTVVTAPSLPPSGVLPCASEILHLLWAEVWDGCAPTQAASAPSAAWLLPCLIQEGSEEFGRVPPAACSILLWWKQWLWTYFTIKKNTNKQQNKQTTKWKAPYTTFRWVVSTHKRIKAHPFFFLLISQLVPPGNPHYL